MNEIVKFTIGTATSDFSETLNLIKSSLLYADETELIGLLEYAVFSYIPYKMENAKDIGQILDFISIVLKSTDVAESEAILSEVDSLSESIKQYKPMLAKKKHRLKDEILAQAKMRKVFSLCKEEIEQHLGQLWNNPESQQIKSLVDNRIISVHDYSYQEFNLEHLVGGYVANLINVIKSKYAYPLFDSVSVNAIQRIESTHIIDIGRLNGEIIRHAGVASGILMTLPTLSNASVDEIVAFKKENISALLNFRKAIFEFSERIGSLPWDDDFQYDIIKLYHTDVVPKVEEINTLLSDTCTLRNFGKRVLADEEFRKKAGWTIGGMATTIVTQSGLIEALDAMRNMLIGFSLLAVAPQIATGFLKGLDTWNHAKDETKEKRNDVTGNTMYYYYKAKQKI